MKNKLPISEDVIKFFTNAVDDVKIVEMWSNLRKGNEIMTIRGFRGSISEPYTVWKLKPNKDGKTFSAYRRI